MCNFKVRNDIDLFNDNIETASVEIISNKSKKIIISDNYRPS